MMKVTGPMNVQMKWLSTRSQHLQGGQNKGVGCVIYLAAETKLRVIDRSPTEPDARRPRGSPDNAGENPTLAEDAGSGETLVGGSGAHDFMCLRL